MADNAAQHKTPRDAAVKPRRRRRIRRRVRSARARRSPATVPRPVRSYVRREFARRTDGPKSSVTQTAAITLGTLGTNGSGGLEIEGVFHLNPLLIKEQAASGASGPIQALCAQYSMWRCLGAQLRLVPIVGSSAVSGTVIRASLNQPGSPSQVTWSGLGARRHIDATPGVKSVLRVPRRDLVGPRDGWWLTDTSNGIQLSAGPSLEIHSFGETVSTFQATKWSGELFLVELHASWQFTNWNMNTKLLDLLDTTLPHGNVSVTASGEGAPVILSVSPEAGLPMEGVHFQNASSGPSTHTSEVIWRAADVGIKVLSTSLPPPLNWLIGGGWWFMKRVFNAPVDGADYTYYLYTTANDAELNNPVKSSGVIPRTSLNGDISVQQMTLPDVITTGGVVTAARTIAPPFSVGYVAMSVSDTLWPNFYGELVLPDDNYCSLALQLTSELQVVFTNVYIVEPTFLQGASELAVVRKPSGRQVRLGFRTATAFEGRTDAIVLATSGAMPSSTPVSTGLVLFQCLSSVVFTRPMRGREVNRENGNNVLNLTRFHSINTQTSLVTGQYYLGVCFGQSNSWSGLEWVTGFPETTTVPASAMNLVQQSGGFSLSPYMVGVNAGMPDVVADVMLPFLSAFPEYQQLPAQLLRNCSLREDGCRRDFYRKLLTRTSRDSASRAAWSVYPPRDFICLISRYISGLQDGKDPGCAVEDAVEFTECVE